jgi:hypothetical protein
MTTARPPTSGAMSAGGPRTLSRMWTSRLIGALFLAGFVIYGTGSILMTSVVDRPDFVGSVGSHTTTLAMGAFLMIATTAVDAGAAGRRYVLRRIGPCRRDRRARDQSWPWPAGDKEELIAGRPGVRRPEGR